MDRRKAAHNNKSPPAGLWRTWTMCVMLGCVFILSTVRWCPWSRHSEKVSQTETAPVNFQPRPQLPVIILSEDFKLSLPEPVRSIYVQDAVVFPDNVMLLVKVSEALDLEGNIEHLECRFDDAKKRIITSSVISIKPRTNDIQMVRCSLPDVNDFPSKAHNVTLGIRDSDVKVQSNAVYNRLPRWSSLVYENLLDSDTLILLAKGLVSKSSKRVDERSVKCVFGKHLPAKIYLETRAITAAQEVIRCEKPPAHLEEKLRGYRVSVWASWLGVLPSVTYYNPDNGPEFFLASYNPPQDCSTANLSTVMEGDKDGGESMSLDEFDVLSSKEIAVRPPTKRKLCACTMVWNKARFIREWVMFHSYIGVEKFFFYDNDSDDGTEDILDSLASHNISRTLWPWIKTQQAAFSHCTILAAGECEWTMFSDVDEYMYPTSYLKSAKKGVSSDARVLHRLIDSESDKVEKVGGNLGEIQFDCNNFGPSGLKKTPEQGVTVGYTCRVEIPERHKSIVLLEAVNSSLLNVLHHFELGKDFQSIKMSRRDAVVNHYKFQAWDAFKMKFVRRAGTYTTDWQKSENVGSKDRTPGLGTEAVKPDDWESQFCEVHDNGLRNFSLSTFGTPDKPRKLKWQIQKT